VKSTGQRVPGPRGMVDGALIVSELHMDGATEDTPAEDLRAAAAAVPVLRDAVAAAQP
jgi:hypothetical protein